MSRERMSSFIEPQPRSGARQAAAPWYWGTEQGLSFIQSHLNCAIRFVGKGA